MLHGNTSLKINDIVEAPVPASTGAVEEKMAALHAFLNFFQQEGKETKATRVARSLAKETLTKLESGRESVVYNSANVAAMVEQDVAPEQATAWLAKVWKELQKYLEQRELGMQDTARQAGLAIYAWPHKIPGAGGAGNSSSYSIEFRNVPDANVKVPALPPGYIAYVRDLTLKPAFWVKPIWNAAGFALHGWRKVAFIAYGIGGIAVVGGLLMVLWLLLTTQLPKLPMGQVLTLLLAAGLVGWLGYVFLHPFWRLLDMRIIMAPDALLSLRERGVQLEAAREVTRDRGPVRVLRLVRYSARCPICADIIHLQDGRKEFPGRLVGRCEEHPAEHVYSFDRHTRIGKPLR